MPNTETTACYACDQDATGLCDRTHGPEGELVAACSRHRTHDALATGERARVVLGASMLRPYRLETHGYWNTIGTRTFATLDAALTAGEDTLVGFDGWETCPGH